MADKLDELTEALLQDRDELVNTARDYAKRGFISGTYKLTVLSICEQHAESGELSERQWRALARSVAFADLRD